MKQKKKVLLAMAALSAVAVGVGTTSTFAWFQAQSAAAAVFKGAGGSHESITAGTTNVQTKSIYIKVDAAPHETSVVLSTKDGKTYAYQGDTLIPGTDAYSAMFDYIEFTGHAYRDEQCKTAADASDFAYINATSGADFSFKIKGGDRTRLSFTAPTGQSDFATAFSTIGDASEKTIYGNIAQNGTITFYQEVSKTNNLATNHLYYSIAGMLSAGATGDDLIASSVESLWNKEESAVQQKDSSTSLTQTLTLTAIGG